MNRSPAAVLVVVPDLMMRQKLVSALQAVGYPVRAVAKVARLGEVLDDGVPLAILVEIDGVDIDGPALTAALSTDERRGTAPVVGFCSHMRTELMDDVRAAGADRVIARGELVRRLEAVMGEITGPPAAEPTE